MTAPTKQEIHDHIDAVIAAIRAEEIARFDMAFWFKKTDCGTVACIGGFSDLIGGTTFYCWQVGQRFGLSREASYRLFLESGTKFEFADITPAIAIRALEDVKRTGTFTTWDDYVGVEA